jgi:anti-sigma B factor antagonist
VESCILFGVHRITVEERMRAVVVTAAGELDAYVAPEFSAALDQAGRDLVADLTAVSFLDSTALGLLVRAVRDRGVSGGRTRVVLPQSTARRIFEITTLDGVLPVSPTLEDALAEIGEKGDRHPL